MAQRDIGTLRTRLSFESDDVNRSLENFRRDLKGLRSEMNLLRSKGKEYTSSLKGMREQADILTRRLQVQQEKVKELKKRYEESVKAKGEDAAQTKNLAAEYNNAVAEMNRTEQQLQRLNEEIRRMESPWTKLGERMTSAGDKLQNFGQTMTDFGKSYTMRVTTPIVAGATAVFKASMDYESAFAGVRKTVDATEEEFAELSAGIREMTKVLPASAVEIAGVAESAGQLGIANEHILSFTRTMIDLGEATNLSAEQAATEFARFANIVGMSQKDFDRLGSTVVALGNNLATTEREIVEMAMRLAGAGAQIGLTEAQIMSFAAALSSVGIEAEAGGSAFSRVMINISNAVQSGGEELGQFAKVAGMSSKEFRKAFEDDAAGAIIAFIAGLSKMSEEGKNVFKVLDDLGLSEIRVRDALLRAAGASDVFTESIEMGTRAWDENIALTEEAEQRYATSESQIKILWNRLKDVAITLGDALVPAVIDALDAAEPFIRKIEDGARAFSEMDEEQQRLILKLLAFTAAIGPVSIGIGQVSSGIGGLLKLGGQLSNVLGKASATGGTGLLARFAMMGPGALTPVGLAITGVGILAGGLYIAHKRSKELEEVTFDLAESLTEEANALEHSINRFEELEEKSKLSNKEMARLIDIYKEIQETSDKKAIEALSKEYEQLLEKSGLTNDELSEYVGLNDELANKLDASNKKISDQGNVLVENIDALKELNEQQRERIKLELEAQAVALENNRVKLLREQRDLQEQINELNEKIAQTEQKISESEERKLELTKQYRKAIEEGNTLEVIYLAKKLEKEAKISNELTNQLETQYDQLLATHDDLEATNKKLNELENIYQKMIDIEMAQIGINAEKGKELKQIDEEIKKLQQQKTELDEKKRKQQISNDEYQKGVDKINTQISKLREAKTRVDDIKQAAERSNKELGKSIDKKVTVDDKGTAQKVHREAEKPARKTVTLNAVWIGVQTGLRAALSRLRIPGFATGTNYAPSGLAWLGEEGPELVKYRDKWALADFGLYNLRGGEQVFTHEQSMKILRALNNIPGYAAGTNMGGETNRIVNRLNQMEQQPNNIYFERMFEGATFIVREETDVEKIAKKLHDYIRINARKTGVIM